ncbi:MAG: membrane protein insertase YidC [Pseudomonadota bacterium]
MGDKDEVRNLILAVALSMSVLIGWYAIFPPPQPTPPPAAEQAETGAPGQTGGQTAVVSGGAGPAQATVSREDALGQSERIAIETPALSGSIALRGGRLDDLDLIRYRETLDEGAPYVTLLNPTNAPNPYYVVYGWLRTATGNPGALPGPTTEWRLAEGDRLTPETPITLAWENGQGLSFRRTFTIDEQYMLRVTQSVENASGTAVDLAPYGYVARRGEPATQGMWILHEGAVGYFDEELSEVDYSDMEELPPNSLEGGLVQAVGVQSNGWLGFTDKYWMTTLIPQPGQAFDAIYKTIPGALRPEFRTEMRLPVMNVPAGERVEMTTMLFAGAKEVATIRNYEAEQGIINFEDAVDWGWFYFLTKPLFTLLAWINGIVGNMGWAIIGLTVVIKAALLPLAYKSYVSMSKMKALQPEMEKIKERAGEDRQKLQQEMMALYKKEKVNPASGCLPILLQIPIFFSLYKVLFVTIEVRHAPFIGWIEDLSAPDPSSFMNLFGLLPYEIPAALALFSIGVFPIVMGITMWLQQKLNPAPTDETQRIIFAWMPWVFMFMLGQFAAGLVIYWTANNVITILQQYAIMRSQGVDVDLMGNIKQSFKRRPGEAVPATAGPAPKAEAAAPEPKTSEPAPEGSGESDKSVAEAQERARPATPPNNRKRKSKGSARKGNSRRSGGRA